MRHIQCTIMDTFMGPVSKRKFNFTPVDNDVKRTKLSTNSIVEDVTSTPYTKKGISTVHQEENISKRFLCPNIQTTSDTLNTENDEKNDSNESEDEEILFVGEIFPIEGQLEVLQKNIGICSRNFQKQCRYAIATHKFDNLVTEHCMPCFTQINEAVKCTTTEAIKTTCRNLVNDVMSFISRIGCSQKVLEDERWLKVMALGVTLSFKLLENKQDLRTRNRHLSGEQLSRYFMTYNFNYLGELHMKLLYACRNEKIAILAILIRVPPLHFALQSQMLAKLIRACLNDVQDTSSLSPKNYFVLMLAYKKLNDLLPHDSKHISTWKNTFNEKFSDQRIPTLILQFLKDQYPSIKKSLSQSLFHVPTSIETIYNNFQKFEREKIYIPSSVYPPFEKDSSDGITKKRNESTTDQSCLRSDKNNRVQSKRLRGCMDGSTSSSNNITCNKKRRKNLNTESDESLVMVIMNLQDFPTTYLQASYLQPQTSRTNNDRFHCNSNSNDNTSTIPRNIRHNIKLYSDHENKNSHLIAAANVHQDSLPVPDNVISQRIHNDNEHVDVKPLTIDTKKTASITLNSTSDLKLDDEIDNDVNILTETNQTKVFPPPIIEIDLIETDNQLEIKDTNSKSSIIDLSEIVTSDEAVEIETTGRSSGGSSADVNLDETINLIEDKTEINNASGLKSVLNDETVDLSEINKVSSIETNELSNSCEKMNKKSSLKSLNKLEEPVNSVPEDNKINETSLHENQSLDLKSLSSNVHFFPEKSINLSEDQSLNENQTLDSKSSSSNAHFIETDKTKELINLPEDQINTSLLQDQVSAEKSSSSNNGHFIETDKPERINLSEDQITTSLLQDQTSISKFSSSNNEHFIQTDKSVESINLSENQINKSSLNDDQTSDSKSNDSPEESINLSVDQINKTDRDKLSNTLEKLVVLPEDHLEKNNVRDTEKFEKSKVSENTSEKMIISSEPAIEITKNMVSDSDLKSQLIETDILNKSEEMKKDQIKTLNPSKEMLHLVLDSTILFENKSSEELSTIDDQSKLNCLMDSEKKDNLNCEIIENKKSNETQITKENNKIIENVDEFLIEEIVESININKKIKEIPDNTENLVNKSIMNVQESSVDEIMKNISTEIDNIKNDQQELSKTQTIIEEIPEIMTPGKVNDVLETVSTEKIDQEISNVEKIRKTEASTMETNDNLINISTDIDHEHALSNDLNVEVEGNVMEKSIPTKNDYKLSKIETNETLNNDSLDIDKIVVEMETEIETSETLNNISTGIEVVESTMEVIKEYGDRVSTEISYHDFDVDHVEETITTNHDTTPQIEVDEIMKTIHHELSNDLVIGQIEETITTNASEEGFDENNLNAEIEKSNKNLEINVKETKNIIQFDDETIMSLDQIEQTVSVDDINNKDNIDHIVSDDLDVGQIEETITSDDQEVDEIVDAFTSNVDQIAEAITTENLNKMNELDNTNKKGNTINNIPQRLLEKGEIRQNENAIIEPVQLISKLENKKISKKNLSKKQRNDDIEKVNKKLTNLIECVRIMRGNNDNNIKRISENISESSEDDVDPLMILSTAAMEHNERNMDQIKNYSKIDKIIKAELSIDSKCTKDNTSLSTSITLTPNINKQSNGVLSNDDVSLKKDKKILQNQKDKSKMNIISVDISTLKSLPIEEILPNNPITKKLLSSKSIKSKSSSTSNVVLTQKGNKTSNIISLSIEDNLPNNDLTKKLLSSKSSKCKTTSNLNIEITKNNDAISMVKELPIEEILPNDDLTKKLLSSEAIKSKGSFTSSIASSQDKESSKVKVLPIEEILPNDDLTKKLLSSEAIKSKTSFTSSITSSQDKKESSKVKVLPIEKILPNDDLTKKLLSSEAIKSKTSFTSSITSSQDKKESSKVKVLPIEKILPNDDLTKKLLSSEAIKSKTSFTSSIASSQDKKESTKVKVLPIEEILPNDDLTKKLLSSEAIKSKTSFTSSITSSQDKKESSKVKVLPIEKILPNDDLTKKLLSSEAIKSKTSFTSSITSSQDKKESSKVKVLPIEKILPNDDLTKKLLSSEAIKSKTSFTSSIASSQDKKESTKVKVLPIEEILPNDDLTKKLLSSETIKSKTNFTTSTVSSQDKNESSKVKVLSFEEILPNDDLTKKLLSSKPTKEKGFTSKTAIVSQKNNKTSIPKALPIEEILPNDNLTTKLLSSKCIKDKNINTNLISNIAKTTQSNKEISTVKELSIEEILPNDDLTKKLLSSKSSKCKTIFTSNAIETTQHDDAISTVKELPIEEILPNDDLTKKLLSSKTIKNTTVLTTKSSKTNNETSTVKSIKAIPVENTLSKDDTHNLLTSKSTKINNNKCVTPNTSSQNESESSNIKVIPINKDKSFTLNTVTSTQKTINESLKSNKILSINVKTLSSRSTLNKNTFLLPITKEEIGSIKNKKSRKSSTDSNTQSDFDREFHQKFVDGDILDFQKIQHLEEEDHSNFLSIKSNIDYQQPYNRDKQTSSSSSSSFHYNNNTKFKGHFNSKLKGVNNDDSNIFNERDLDEKILKKEELISNIKLQIEASHRNFDQKFLNDIPSTKSTKRQIFKTPKHHKEFLTQPNPQMIDEFDKEMKKFDNPIKTYSRCKKRFSTEKQQQPLENYSRSKHDTSILSDNADNHSKTTLSDNYSFKSDKQSYYHLNDDNHEKTSLSDNYSFSKRDKQSHYDGTNYSRSKKDYDNKKFSSDSRSKRDKQNDNKSERKLITPTLSPLSSLSDNYLRSKRDKQNDEREGTLSSLSDNYSPSKRDKQNDERESTNNKRDNETFSSSNNDWKKKLRNNFITTNKKSIHITIDTDNIKPLRENELSPLSTSILSPPTSVIDNNELIFSDVSDNDFECDKQLSTSPSFKINPDLKDPLSLDLKFSDGPPNYAILNEPLSNNDRRSLMSSHSMIIENTDNFVDDVGSSVDSVMDIFSNSSILSDNDLHTTISPYDLYNSIEGQNFHTFTTTDNNQKPPSNDNVPQSIMQHKRLRESRDPCFAPQPQAILDSIVQAAAAQHL